MTVLTALLVDDEEHNRKTLQTLLSRHCPKVQVIGEAWSAESAFDLIHRLKPRLVFLDVMMPRKSGFELLKMLPNIDFEVIFVSAYNEYAVTAFEYNALGYILKPVDFEKLIRTVNKAVASIELGHHDERVVRFINTLDPKSDQLAKVAVHHRDKVVLLEINNIVSVVAEGDVSHITLTTGERYSSSKELKLFEGMFSEHGNFSRISRNCLLNLDQIKSYEKGDPCVLTMSKHDVFAVSRRRKTEILGRLKIM